MLEVIGYPKLYSPQIPGQSASELGAVLEIEATTSNHEVKTALPYARPMMEKKTNLANKPAMRSDLCVTDKTGCYFRIY